MQLRLTRKLITAVLLSSCMVTAPLFAAEPEGGLSSAEEDLALQHGFAPVTLGGRVLRAETAPLAALAALTLA